MTRNPSPYYPLSAREERALDAAQAEHEDAIDAARDALTATPDAALPVVLAAMGLDPVPERDPIPSDWPVYLAVAALYSRAMRRAGRLPRGVMDLDSEEFALCTALSATLDKMAERKAVDDELARTARIVPVVAVVPGALHPVMQEAMRGFGTIFGARS